MSPEKPKEEESPGDGWEQQDLGRLHRKLGSIPRQPPPGVAAWTPP